MPQYKLFIVSLLAVFLTSCATQSIPDPDPTYDTPTNGTDTDANDDGGLGAGEP
ncbi:MAG: hypothetical protein IIA11_09335, partial [Proteobacteria bacterium]|nr:hypothetical protein [Pseudomonadota bacterium]